VPPLYNNILLETIFLFVVQRELLKGGKIKNDLNVWETSVLIVIGRELLLRGTFKRGSTITDF
jgi:hypothetical protein